MWHIYGSEINLSVIEGLGFIIHALIEKIHWIVLHIIVAFGFSGLFFIKNTEPITLKQELCPYPEPGNNLNYKSPNNET